MARQYWLIKSEPNTYGYEKLVQQGRTVWDGVRNFEARNNLRAMKEGDLALFYHSTVGKEVIGVARVVREAYADPSAEGEDWSVVEVAPAFALRKPVSLETMKFSRANQVWRKNTTTLRISSEVMFILNFWL